MNRKLEKAIIFCTIFSISLAMATGPPNEPRHPISQINPVDEDLNLSEKDIFNLSQLEFTDGMVINGNSIRDSSNSKELVKLSDSGEISIPNGDLNLSNNEVKGLNKAGFEGSIRIGGEGTFAKDNEDIAIGKGAFASDLSDNGRSVAIGKGSNSSSYSLAIGEDSEAAGGDSMAIGTRSYTGGYAGIAIGVNSESDTYRSTVLGKDAKAQGVRSLSLGSGAIAGNERTISIGDNSESKLSDAIALGASSLSSSFNSTSIGTSSLADGYGTVSVGPYSNSSDYRAITLGIIAEASGSESTAIGSVSSARDYRASALGALASATGSESTSIGSNSLASDYRATSLGIKSNASGSQSTALGSNSRASRERSTAIGYKAKAISPRSVAIGFNVTAPKAGKTTLGSSNGVEITKGDLNLSLNDITYANSIQLGPSSDTYEEALEVYRGGTKVGAIDQSLSDFRFKAQNGADAELVNDGNDGLKVDGSTGQVGLYDANLDLNSNDIMDVDRISSPNGGTTFISSDTADEQRYYTYDGGKFVVRNRGSGTFENYLVVNSDGGPVEIKNTDLNIGGNNITSTSGNVSIGQDLKVHGDVWSAGADLAEIYSSPQKLEKGEVVAIDTKRDDSVVRTSEKFQDTVVGVVSTDPGNTLNWNEEGYPIALAGKVPVKVSEENGEIKRGDRLVPSSKQGTAMKCEIWDPMGRTNTSLREVVAHNEGCRSSTIGKALNNSKNKQVLVKVE